ncbi:hypothetical protein [Clostridium faecium]|uniref:Uncharacterized protein n=1 Tax=Clostridium faecium TaxID=2762223 RepID=A0ABR8YPK6_9CLOT|nr:hypothetical protein [Clostridium faecium]MBD8045849.1 hypothetical protein [Clostridium faecium]
MNRYIKLAKFTTFFLGILLIINEVIQLYNRYIIPIESIIFISFILIILVAILILDKKNKSSIIHSKEDLTRKEG